jgi:hypothetical protein
MTIDIIDDYFANHKYSNLWRWSIVTLCITLLLSLFNLIELPNSVNLILYGMVLFTLLANANSHLIYKRIGKLQFIENTFIIKLHDSLDYTKLKDVKRIEISTVQSNHYNLTFDNGKEIRVEMKTKNHEAFKRACLNNNIKLIKDSFINNIKSLLTKRKTS